MLTLPPFEILRPATLSDAVLSLADGDVVPYAGGTELMLAMKLRLLSPQVLLDLKGVAGLDDIYVDEATGALHVGAMATHRVVSKSQVVREVVPMLSEIASRVGNPRVRSQGTVGGNLAFAEPRSDLTTALVALDAVACLESSGSTRRLPVTDFLTGAYSTSLTPDELLTGIEIPRTTKQGTYLKYQTSERPMLGVAVVMDSETCRLVVGSITERPESVDITSLSSWSASEFASSLEITDDSSGSERYKRHMVEVYVRRCLKLAQDFADERGR